MQLQNGNGNMTIWNPDQPWGRAGRNLDNLATSEEMLAGSGLDYDLLESPITVKRVASGRLHNLTGPTVPGYKAVLRADTGQVLGVVKNTYRLTQNRDVFRFFDEITTAEGGPKYVGAGSLRDGAVVWAMAKMPESIRVTGGDVLQPYLLFTDSHDGSMRLTCMWTAMRLLCSNALINTIRGMVTGYGKRHTSPLGDGAVLNARATLGIASENARILGDAIQIMGNWSPTDGEVGACLMKLFRSVKDRNTEGKELWPTPNMTNRREHVRMLYQSGVGNHGETGWDLYNAITEYMDHHRTMHTDGGAAARDERSFAGQFWGPAATFKANAANLILEMAR